MPAREPLSAEGWLAGHPYLEAVARFQREVDAALAGLAAEGPAVPDWSEYLEDFVQGEPVLRSASVAIDLAPAGTMIRSMVEGLSSRPLPAGLAEDIAGLRDELLHDGMTPDRMAGWLTGEDPFTPSRPGLLRHLGWTVMAAHVAPVTRSFAAWRDDDRWLRRYCPFCGSSPAMGQLVGTDPGRRRFLCCGRCRSRWAFRRTVCPFCETDSQGLASLSIEGESGLRIDWCEACKAYLKTYDGEGDERVLLADWSSLHLDVIALDRGLERAAASLYEIAPTLGQPETMTRACSARSHQDS